MKKKTNTNKRPAKKEQVPDKTIAVFQRLIEGLEPPPNMSVSEWAEAYRIIPSEYGADAGKWVSKDYLPQAGCGGSQARAGHLSAHRRGCAVAARQE